jgi:hypothetical protein
MNYIIFYAAMFLFLILVFWYTDYKPKSEIKKMGTIQPRKDILLALTPPVPFFKASLVAVPFFVLGYYVYSEKFRTGVFMLFAAGILMAALFSILYWFVRGSKNSLNNYCLKKCEELKIEFIPGNLNSKPVVFCEPWSKKDARRIMFASKEQKITS